MADNIAILSNENHVGHQDKCAYSEVCTFEATVVTGFETVAKEECQEKLGVHARVERGRIFFDLPVNRAREVLDLKGIDNIYVVIQDIKGFGFPQVKDLVKEKLIDLPNHLDWPTGLEVWRQIYGYTDVQLDQLMFGANTQSSQQFKEVSDHGDISTEEVPSINNPEISFPCFRATCYRSGQNHCFSSMEAAAEFGGAIKDKFLWKVDMKKFHIEVVLNITNDDIYVCLALTKESLHRRNLEYFGPTSLRATVAYNMLRLCNIKPGDLVCDPMCGGGSIPIEAALNWPEAHSLCGDNHELALPRTYQNVGAVNKKLEAQGKQKIKVDIFKWDACKLPLKDKSVDVIITDMPFGKRIGSKIDNRVLYPNFLKEIARVCCPKTGRVALLTQDKKTLSRAVVRYSKFLNQTRVLGINLGGLSVCVFLFHRTRRLFQEETST